MSTEIKVWQINGKSMSELDTTMVSAGRKETTDLQAWIKSNPVILGKDILIIGEHSKMESGNIPDFLGIDRSGNCVVIELKRDLLPREVLAQAIDYASEIATWDTEKLNEVCQVYAKQQLGDYLNENFQDFDFQDISLNQSQRILVVGTSIEDSLLRMIKWLSGRYGLLINAAILKYVKTKGGDELLARTWIIPEEEEKEKSQKQQRKIPMSDEPGQYQAEELKILLTQYFNEDRVTPTRIREIILPLCLDHEPVKREEIKKELIKRKIAKDESLAGVMLSTISKELGMKSRDYLRQIIKYERGTNEEWEKDNYRINSEYKDLIIELLGAIKKK
jgi:hypothetical protein